MISHSELPRYALTLIDRLSPSSFVSVSVTDSVSWMKFCEFPVWAVRFGWVLWVTFYDQMKKEITEEDILGLQGSSALNTISNYVKLRLLINDSWNTLSTRASCLSSWGGDW